jgi:hypothetical protein
LLRSSAERGNDHGHRIDVPPSMGVPQQPFSFQPTGGGKADTDVRYDEIF